MEDQELSDAIKSRASYHPAPAALRAQLQERLRAELAASGPRSAGGSPPKTGLLASLNPSNWLPMGLAFVLGLAIAFGVTLLVAPAAFPLGGKAVTASNDIASQVVASHVRSLMASHLNDVASTDQHTVKPWFNGKVDFSPPVNDLAADGFPLTGGRLDYLDGRPVAALVYHRKLHPINLFVWPDNGAELPTTTVSEQGYHVFQWRHAGMRYAAVSDVSADDLRNFVETVQQRIAAR
jgi:anti-sigma factor RsiW